MKHAAYRPDIDGLRAFAVTAVIFFHFGIAGFTGGYVGVDVFFVISGYLITQILIHEHETAGYSITRFYERRVRRLIPALIVMLALTLGCGWWFLTPTEYSNLGKSTLAALAFMSNITFWKTTGYFDADTVRPILHSWSLAVEEQFYIVYPLILTLFYRFAGRAIRLFVLAALAGSLLLSAVGAFWSPSATFFLFPTRAWELMIGAALALRMVPSLPSRATADAAALLGVLMLVISVAFYDENTVFPGATALLPCLGSALMIHSGSHHTTRTRKILSWPPLVTIGLMSYSLYLYHFPIHVFAARFLLRELSLGEVAMAIAATGALSFLSWRYVERPFRQRGRFNRKQIFMTGALASLAVAVPAAAIVANGGVPERFSDSERSKLAADNSISPKGRLCLNVATAEASTTPACRLGIERPAHARSLGDFVVIGDSHAAAVEPAIDLAAHRLGLTGTMIAYNACAPFLGVGAPVLSWRDAKGCYDRNNQWLQLVLASGAQTVILAGFWSGHLKAWGRDGRNAQSYMVQAIDRTLVALAGKRVILLLDVPRAQQPPGTQAVFAHRFGRPIQLLQSGSDDNAARLIRRSAAGRAEVIDLSERLCGQPCRALDARGQPILADKNHVTASAAREYLTPVFRALASRHN